MATYDSLRRSLRTLESSLDAKLTTYSKLASSIPRAGASSGQGYEMGAVGGSSGAGAGGVGGAGVGTGELEEEIGGMLDRLRDLNDQLTRILSTPSAPSGPSVSHAVQRHREVLQDYAKDFRRTKQNVQTALDQANLLSNVRGEIESYKTQRSSTTDALLSERGHIDSSHRMADDLLAQAHDTRHSFHAQSTQLSSVQSRMSSVLSSFPGINNILGMIQTRRRRDAVIMGLVVGVGLVLLWGYMGR